MPNPSIKRDALKRALYVKRSHLPDHKSNHPLSASLHNLPPPHSAYPRQLASEISPPQPFLPPGVQLVKPDSRLVPSPLGSSPESAAHQNDAPAPHP